VVVGHDEARGVDDDARTERTLNLLARAAGAAEETAEDRIVEQRDAILDDPGSVDVHHRGSDSLHRRREAQFDLAG
jgi:hypothetical protein